MKKYKLLCCKVLEREAARLTCTCKNMIDVTMMRQKLHDRPERLSKILQEEIDQIETGQHRYTDSTGITECEGILLGYGLCSNAVKGLHSSRYPLVIPRAHDCVTLLMGDKDTYTQYYGDNPGTFYYWPGAVEHMRFFDEVIYEKKYQWYLTRYHGNEKRAKKAVRLEKSFFDTYQKITYIGWEDFDFPEFEREVESYAVSRNWAYERIKGRDTLLRQLLDGDWDEEKFLVVPPGYQVEPSYDNQIIKAVKTQKIY